MISFGDNACTPQLGLKGAFQNNDDYHQVLSAQVFEVFGVTDPQLALKAIGECLTCIAPDLENMGLNDAKTIMQLNCENVLSLFHEMRPRDSFELMAITKMIILHFLSNREFITGAGARSEELKSMRHSRGIKMSRLFLEFKEKLDKHRKPDQCISVQHNHIHNEGQAIIGSQLNTGGGR